MGPHAGESNEQIFSRKIQDITNTGLTYWFQFSNKANPSVVQKTCYDSLEEKKDCYCIFIEPAKKGGATATVTNDIANQWSHNNEKCNFLKGHQF
jgi:hypothetical protein